MAEVDSDEDSMMKEEEDEENEISKVNKKQTYTKATRDVSDRRPLGNKKAKTSTVESGELNPDEIQYEDDEEYYQKLIDSKESEKISEMDMLRMQLEFEKEEAERKSKEAKSGGSNNTSGEGEKKTRIDEDGTEYEWDPAVKGWFPKVNF